MRTPFTALHAKLATATLAALLALAQAPAHAGLLDISYSGTVTAFTAGGMPQGVQIGDVASVHLRLDTDALTDITATANAVYGTSYAQVQATRLDTAGASLSLGIHGFVFTQADHIPFLDNAAVGMTGPFAFFVNGSFGGISYFGLNAAGNGFSTKGLMPEPFDFAGGSFAAAGPSYAGYFDPASLRVAPVPEPTSALLLAAGLAGLGALSLRRLRTTA